MELQKVKVLNQNELQQTAQEKSQIKKKGFRKQMKQSNLQSSIGPLTSDTSQQTALLQRLKSHLQQLSKSQSQYKQTKSQLTRKLKQLLEKKQYFTNQKVIQQRKYKSLNLLVNELQSSFQKLLVEMRSKQLQLTQDQDKKVVLQNHLLREELIKLNEIIKEDEKLFSFLKQLQINKPNITNFIKKSDFIQAQAETIAKLQTYINQLANPNLECRRKWNMLQKQMDRSERHLKIYKLQQSRQSELLKQLYEEYLEKINSAKTKIVHFNQTKREKLLTEFLVQQMALIQQKRLQVEEENKNLHYHMEQLQLQNEKVTLQNSQLQSFFTNESRQQQSRLAMKMKSRIDQLKDSLVQMQTRNQILSVLNKRNSNLQYVRTKLSKSKQANDFLLLKQEKINQGDFSQLDQKQISQFFSAIIKQTQLKTQTTKQRSLQINNELKQLKMKQILLQSQVTSLQQIVKQNSMEQTYHRKEILNK